MYFIGSLAAQDKIEVLSKGEDQLLQMEPETTQLVSTMEYDTFRNDENQKEITDVLKTRNSSYIRRIPTTSVQSVTQRSYTSQSEYDQNRPMEQNSVGVEEKYNYLNSFCFV